MSEQRFRHRGQEVVADIRREADSVVVRSRDSGEETRYESRRVGSAEYVLADPGEGGRNHTVYAVRDGDDIWVHVDGRTWLLERLRARRAAHAPGGLSSPIPATVQEILVANGDSVKAGQVLIVVTAMKMQLEIKAPHSGVVTGLGTAVGEQVGAGVQLLQVVAPERA